MQTTPSIIELLSSKEMETWQAENRRLSELGYLLSMDVSQDGIVSWWKEIDGVVTPHPSPPDVEISPIK